ncbi:MAG: hypothetical protein ACD_9C00014G0001, partial [uncultured bacterium]
MYNLGFYFSIMNLKEIFKTKNQNQKISSQEKIFSFSLAKKSSIFDARKIKENITKTRIFFKDHLHLLFKSAAVNHLRIQKCKITPERGEVCNLSFESYSDLKKYQKKVRLFTYSFSSTVASVMIAMLVVQVFFPGGTSHGASYTWSQSDWNTLSAVDNAEHNSGGDNTTWTKYFSKDDAIAAGDVLALEKNEETLEKKSDTDFNAAGSTFTNSSVTGAGDGASITLGKEVSQVTTSGISAFALTKDGKVYAWGSGGRLGLGVGEIAEKYVPVEIPNLTDVVSIAAGSGGHVLALKSNGDVYAWGLNGYGQLGVGDTVTKEIPTKISTLSNVKAIGTGQYHSLAVVGDNGDVYAWGYNINNQLGNNSSTNSSVPVRVGVEGAWLSGAAAVTGMNYSSLALMNNGTVWSWGSNNVGQLGLGSVGTQVVPAQISNFTNVKAIRSGTSHVIALTNDGDVYTWGYNNVGQLGDNTTVNKNTPQDINLGGIIGIAAGNSSLYAMGADGKFWVWGYNYYGELGIGTQGTGTNKIVPFESNLMDRIIDVACNTSGSGGAAVALKSDGSVWTWGYGSSIMGTNSYSSAVVTSPVQVKLWSHPADYFGSTEPQKTITKLAPSDSHMLAVRNGELYSWGSNAQGQLGTGDNIGRFTPMVANGLNNITDISSSPRAFHSLVLSGGNVYTFGSNASRQASPVAG